MNGLLRHSPSIWKGTTADILPYLDDILLWYKNRDDYTLTEIKQGLNASILPSTAEFGGSNYLSKTASGIISNLANFTISFKFIAKNTISGRRTFYSEDGGTPLFIFEILNATQFRILKVGDAVGIKTVTLTPGGAITLNATHYLTFRFTNTTTLDWWYDGVKKTQTSLDDTGTTTTTINSLGKYSSLLWEGNLIKTDIFNASLADADIEKFHNNIDFIDNLIARYVPLGVSEYEPDILGTNGFMEWNGDAERGISVSGELYYLDNGYSIYWKQGENNILIPYSPNATLISELSTLGFELIRKYSGDLNDVNMAPCSIDFDPTDSANALLDIFDRSNATIYNDLARINDYDSGETYIHRIEDISDIDIYNGWKNTGYKKNYSKVNKVYDLKYIPTLLKEIVVYGDDKSDNLGYLNTYFNFGIDNSEIVQWNSITDIPETGQVISAPTTPGVFTLHWADDQRVYQNKGYVKKIQLYVKTLTNITSFKLYGWNYTSATGKYDKMYEIEILSLLSVGLNNIELPIPVLIGEGDFIGFNYIASSATDVVYAVEPLDTLGASYPHKLYSKLSAPLDEQQNWTAESETDYIPITYTQGISPKIITIGDSIMESAFETTSLLRVGTFSRYVSWIAKMAALDYNITYQAKGVSGEYISSGISTRFTRDVVNINPQIAIINGGINDLTSTTVSKAQFLAGWTSVLDECESSGIIPVVWLMLPNEALDTAAMRDWEEWNDDLTTLVATYDDVILIDMNPDLSQFRTGGDPGNLWDWKPEYRRDGLHPNAAGDTKIAELVYESINHLI
jgi:lysophospholipase L1-like esterase